MALEIKCDLYLNNNEIVIYDSSSGATGWSSNTISLGTELVEDIDSITLDIDGIAITISIGTNEDLLPCLLSEVSSPRDLIYTINPDTYSAFFDTVYGFGNFSDGEHTVVYTVVVGLTTYTYTGSIFTYKDVEEATWTKFHELATTHSDLKLGDKFIDQALNAYAWYKGLEYSTRTSLDNDVSLEILATLEKILDFNNCKSC